MRVSIIGCGTVGGRAARQVLSVPGVEEILLFDAQTDASASLAAQLGQKTRAVHGDPLLHVERFDVALLALPPDHTVVARSLLSAGIPVVSTSDSVADVAHLLTLHAIAETNAVPLVVGVGFAPGLTDVLALHAATLFDVVREVHTAKMGTAGPACARQHHAALSQESSDWRDGEWILRPGGSGRELVWFPDPIGGADCYRAALPEALLLHRLFPNADRLSGRMAATRRDRFTSRLPMLRKPHAEAGPGAVRVEVRGSLAGEEASVVLACMDRPSVAAGTISALTISALMKTDPYSIRKAPRSSGVFGIGEFINPVAFLTELAKRGVRCARFEGTTER